MRSRLLAPLLLALAAGVPAPGAYAGGPAMWHRDLATAAAVARAEKKDLLVDFTGSDWCPACERLHVEILDHAAFVEGVTDRYVLVSLDFPRGEAAKGRVPDADGNAEAQARYGVGAFPTVLLMTHEGYVFGRTGYRIGGIGSYLEHLAELRARGRPLLERSAERVAAARAAIGAARWKLVDAIVTDLEDSLTASGAVRKLTEAARLALAPDSDAPASLARRAVLAVASVGASDPALIAAARRLDPRNERGLVEAALDSFARRVGSESQVRAAVAEVEFLLPHAIHDDDIAVALLANAARWCRDVLKDTARARRLATALRDSGRDLDPESRRLVDSILVGE